jgi:enoyl-CoA hydratase
MMTAIGTPSNPTSGSRQAVIQEIAPDPAQALEAGIGLARKIAACGPLGIKTTLESAHLSIDESEAAAFAKLDEQFGGLFRTEDFIEGRKAEAEGLPLSTRASRRARVRVIAV